MSARGRDWRYSLAVFPCPGWHSRRRRSPGTGQGHSGAVLPGVTVEAVGPALLAPRVV